MPPAAPRPPSEFPTPASQRLGRNNLPERSRQPGEGRRLGGLGSPVRACGPGSLQRRKPQDRRFAGLNGSATPRSLTSEASVAHARLSSRAEQSEKNLTRNRNAKTVTRTLELPSNKAVTAREELACRNKLAL